MSRLPLNRVLQQGGPYSRQTAVLLTAAAAVWSALSNVPAIADQYDGPPVNYAAAEAKNAVSQLQQRLDSASAKLKFEDHFGYLKSVLAALEVPESSQMLVFSKTSLQARRIWPQKPRAIYFSDEIYVGFCQAGDVIEVSVADPQLGAVFYTLDQEPVEKPVFRRQTDNCLMCHASSATQSIPGHVVRSVFPDPQGQPILSSGSYRIDHTSPLEKRWGGWYVTGQHGAMKHLGNLIIRGRNVPETIDNSAGLNLQHAPATVDLANYLTPHSDIVALMVLEHQAQGHNLITRANFLTRTALFQQQEMNRALGKREDERWESTTSRVKDAGEPLVKYLLFQEEAKLSGQVIGTSAFAQEFQARGPRDSQGRSLRQLDLKGRMFRYPLSYLIYSASFRELPAEVRDYVWQRLWDVLNGRDAGKEFAHLSSADRQAIVEILRETHPDRPDYWK
jgi:hypothetical protein